ncbi:hypothetical protein [Pseudarthrobacter sp. AB1]|uniref:hypothetical protein n=1 Tax=Pseudarthrobacter sp. AB1 TaxID=2138309 RepID=UPI00186B9A44|nr:hypothetical protein [Pseudarthrobacter sp. AB1]MBE4719333.1 hypothetical protein [Pseudarthrobacter sp. AB1]
MVEGPALQEGLALQRIFKPEAPAVRRKGYLIFAGPSTEAMHWYGSDTITSSYASWLAPTNPRPKALVDAIAGLSKDEKALT